MEISSPKSYSSRRVVMDETGSPDLGERVDRIVQSSWIDRRLLAVGSTILHLPPSVRSSRGAGCAVHIGGGLRRGAGSVEAEEHHARARFPGA